MGDSTKGKCATLRNTILALTSEAVKSITDIENSTSMNEQIIAKCRNMLPTDPLRITDAQITRAAKNTIESIAQDFSGIEDGVTIIYTILLVTLAKNADASDELTGKITLTRGRELAFLLKDKINHNA
jgi:hypothetical protein